MFLWEKIRDSYPSANWNSIELSLAAPEITSWCLDSRKIKKNDWFIAIKGSHFDGHDYIEVALDQGAAGIVYSDKSKVDSGLLSKVKAIKVENSLEFFHAIVSVWRLYCEQVQVIAITGSMGKTTCKDMLQHILKKFGRSIATEANFNNEIGVPLTLQRITKETDFCIVEMGARKVHDIMSLVKMAHPGLSLLLNAELSHVGIFGNKENLRKTKLEIIEGLEEKAKGLVFFDDEILFRAAQKMGAEVRGFGKAKGADYLLMDCVIDEKSGMMLNMRDREGSTYEVKLPMCFNYAQGINALAALSACFELGLAKTEAVLALADYMPSGGRFKPFNLNQKLKLIDDSYNSSGPESVEMGLKSVLQFCKNQRRSIVLGDMLELGSFSEQAHRRIGKFCADHGNEIDQLILVGSQVRFLSEEAKKLGFAKEKISEYGNVQELVLQKDELLQEEGIIYIKASRGLSLDKLVHELTKRN